MENSKVIIINQLVFDELVNHLKFLAKRVDYLHKMQMSKKLGEHLNGEQVCNILNIKPRTLQTYRDSGKIGFTQIGRKIFYRVNDVDKLLKENINNGTTNLKKNRNGHNGKG